MKAEDILPDDVNLANFGGLQVRKGTIAAFLANAQTFLDKGSSDAERHNAENLMIQALPAMRALKVFEVFQITDGGLRELISQHLGALQ